MQFTCNKGADLTTLISSLLSCRSWDPLSFVDLGLGFLRVNTCFPGTDIVCGVILEGSTHCCVAGFNI